MHDCVLLFVGHVPKAKEKALKRAKGIGVNLDVNNAWSELGAPAQELVFGPCPMRDNIYQCLPQVTLHGMDEGLTCKLNHGVLEATIEAAHEWKKYSATEVRINIRVLNIGMYISKTAINIVMLIAISEMYISMYISLFMSNVLLW